MIYSTKKISIGAKRLQIIRVEMGETDWQGEKWKRNDEKVIEEVEEIHTVGGGGDHFLASHGLQRMKQQCSRREEQESAEHAHTHTHTSTMFRVLLDNKQIDL